MRSVGRMYFSCSVVQSVSATEQLQRHGAEPSMDTHASHAPCKPRFSRNTHEPAAGFPRSPLSAPRPGTSGATPCGGPAPRRPLAAGELVSGGWRSPLAVAANWPRAGPKNKEVTCRGDQPAPRIRLGSCSLKYPRKHGARCGWRSRRCASVNRPVLAKTKQNKGLAKCWGVKKVLNRRK